MKSTVISLLAVLLLGLPASNVALAQDHERGWKQGHIVQVTEVHIKDGMFNAYINDLNNVWRKFIEKQMETGDVIRYGIYSMANTRKGEPDLILTVVYKNWATFDRGVEYFEKMSAELMGSMEEMREANIDRGELREIGDTYTLQELHFMDED